MILNTCTIENLARTVERLLAPSGENHWLHVQGVAEKAKQVSRIFDRYDALSLIAAAYLHDVGYAPVLYKTGFPPIDGAYYVRLLGHPRLASLVAHHSEARFEAHLRGLGSLLSTFPREYSPVADALTYCDLTTSPTGTAVTLQERVIDIFRRYKETDVASLALHQSLPFLSLAVKRTQSRIRSYKEKTNIS